jgi:hypothetical protein
MLYVFFQRISLADIYFIINNEIDLNFFIKLNQIILIFFIKHIRFLHQPINRHMFYNQ